MTAEDPREATATQQRLKRFRSHHPDVEIVSHGYWQAVIPKAHGETIITRWDLGELLDKLDDLLASRAKGSHPPGPASQYRNGSTRSDR
jgi:hypothetical protein